MDKEDNAHSEKSDYRREKVVRVCEARKRDTGRLIIRLDTKTMNELNLSTGDVVEIIGEGSKSTGAITWPSYPQDQDRGIIRIDPLLRTNIGVNIGDEVRIRRVDAKVAKSIVLTPHEVKIKSNARFESFVKRKLLSYPVKVGNLISISIGVNREILFKITSLNPENTICIVNQSTQLHIKTDYDEFSDKDLDNELSPEENISYLKKKIDLLNYLNEFSPLKDEINDLKEKINSLNERLDYAMVKIEKLISKISSLEEKKKEDP